MKQFDELIPETLVEECDFPQQFMDFLKSKNVRTLRDVVQIDRTSIGDLYLLAQVNIIRMAIGVCGEMESRKR
jgi:hypothetical protein